MAMKRRNRRGRSDYQQGWAGSRPSPSDDPRGRPQRWSWPARHAGPGGRDRARGPALAVRRGPRRLQRELGPRRSTAGRGLSRPPLAGGFGRPHLPRILPGRAVRPRARPGRLSPPLSRACGIAGPALLAPRRLLDRRRSGDGPSRRELPSAGDEIGPYLLRRRAGAGRVRPGLPRRAGRPRPTAWSSSRSRPGRRPSP